MQSTKSDSIRSFLISHSPDWLDDIEIRTFRRGGVGASNTRISGVVFPRPTDCICYARTSRIWLIASSFKSKHNHLAISSIDLSTVSRVR